MLSSISGLIVSHLAVVSLATPFISDVDPPNILKRAGSGCQFPGQTSCHNTTVQSDLCCFEAPGGLLVQPQFWNARPSKGPSDSWTIHGLWPDKCDGTFEQSCDSSREYSNIDELLTIAGAQETLSFMNEFWVDINDNNEQFWEHEWGKHGTCMSTLRPSCLPSGSPRGTEAVHYFNAAVRQFKLLPTFDWLSQQGITPSESQTFSRSQLTSALKRASGVVPGIDCKGGQLNQVYWYYNLIGSVVDGKFVLIDAPKPGSCPQTGIKYLPKTGMDTNPTSPTPPPPATPPPATNPGELPTRAIISARRSSGSITGGLLSAGTWSTQTLATYTLSGSASSFMLTSSKGKCAVQSSALTCGSNVSTASTFSAVALDGQLVLAFQGSTEFTSDTVPSGTIQQTVFTGSGHAQDYTLVISAR